MITIESSVFVWLFMYGGWSRIIQNVNDPYVTLQSVAFMSMGHFKDTAPY